LHVGVDLGQGIYSVTVGAEVSEVTDVPIQGVLKVIPGGRYAHFPHRMSNGGYGEAFSQIEHWVEASGTTVEEFGLQLYDRDFDPAKKESVLHIFIPLR
jgi:predicted transcriptional regulator YdeE